MAIPEDITGNERRKTKRYKKKENKKYPYKRKRNITQNKIFLLLFGVWIIDFTTTIIGVNFFGLKETNFFAAFLYGFGIIGWFFMFFFAGFILYFYSLFLSKITFKFCPPIVPFIIISYILFESFEIVHNLYLIFT